MKIKAIQKENQLKDVLSYITGKYLIFNELLDYMRAVIENGNNFTKQNLMMMLNELKPEFLDF